MARTELQTAADHLTNASETTDHSDATDRLTDLADQLETLATGDRGPDHGRMARIQTALNEVKEDVGAEATDEIDDAKDAISSYRESVEGV